MEIGDLLKGLALDPWYKVMMWLGAGVFAVSLFLDTKGLTNGQVQCLAGGLFLLGLGVWKSHKVESWIKPANTYTGGPALMRATVHKPGVVGVILVVAGIVLFRSGVFNILRS